MTRDIPEVAEARARRAGRPTADGLRADAAGTVWHVGRSWTGHDIEDRCPCPKAPCGLVEQRSLTGGCDEHNGRQTMRQGHAADRCPGGAK
jgi:hypothetical protein